MLKSPLWSIGWYVLSVDVVDLIEKQMSLWHLSMSPQQCHSFKVYYDELVRFSRPLGLTTASVDDLGTKHFLDSLLALPYLASMRLDNILDVGSGGGFPGLCLATMLPACSFTLCERNTKKAGFLLSTSSLMGLKNVTIYPDDFQKLLQHFDLCTFRGLMKLTPASAKAILKKARQGLAYKGRMTEAKKEASALEAAGLFAHLQLVQDISSTERCFLWFTDVSDYLYNRKT